MCRVLSVSRNGYYTWLRRPQGAREQQNELLVAQIRQIYNESRRTYGSPRITQALRHKGLRYNHKRVERLMRINGIRAKMKRRFKAFPERVNFERWKQSILKLYRKIKRLIH